MSATEDKPVAVVTGGAGFIGSHMVDLLVEKGFRVRVVDDLRGGREKNIAGHAGNPDVSLDRLDIRDIRPDEALFAGSRYVFHFAGIGDIVPSIEHPSDYMDVNVQGTVAVLEAARHAGAAKVVYAASSSCYGLVDVPTTEDHPIRPEYPYALSKNLGEHAALHWNRVYGLPVNSIRIFNAYGPRSRTTGAYGAVFGVFLRQKLEGAPLTIVGDGEQTRDFIFVTDVARAFFAAAEVGMSGRVWNVGAGKPQSVNRLATLLGGPRTQIPDRPGEPRCTWADISRIQADTGWAPIVGFEDGVARVVERIEDWRDAPLWTPQTIEKATESWFRFLGPDHAT
jgi:UDP-glucose 4-epimerase